MTTLFPPGYGGFPSYQFSSPNQFNNRYQADPYRRREATFAPRYATQPFYQPPFNPAVAYAAAQNNRDRQGNIGEQLINAFNELDYRYRQQQYQRRLAKIQRQYWNLQSNATPGPPLSIPPPPPALNYGRGTLYEYEKETEFVPYPIYLNRGGQTTAGFGQPWGAGFGGSPALPPKIRVIFIPNGQSYGQQPFTGPLAMPPFLYNRMSQPLSSCPPPPPLPQLGSLPLTPAVHQMVLQRYSNPLAVLPYNSNWQTPQMMMPNVYQAFQQQQQQQQLQLQLQQPISALQSVVPAPQLSMPPCMPSYPSVPAAPQSYLSLPAPAPAPAQFYGQLPPAPQSYLPPPMPSAPVQAYAQLPPAPQAFIAPPMAPAPVQGYSAYPSAPQAYNSAPNYMQGYSNASAPPVISANQPSTQSSSGNLSSPYGSSSLSPSSSLGGNSNSSFPSICRACPPAPPPLSVLVTGHCWVQHCAACHHVPTPDANPNVRPTGGRSTPLMRYPTVPQYVPYQTQQYPQQYQQQQQQQQQAQYYSQANAPFMMRPWLRKTPPLPPNCFIVSDRSYNQDGSRVRRHDSHRQHRSHKHGSRSKHRSTTVASRSTPSGDPSAQHASKSVSPRRASKSSKDPNVDKATGKERSVESHTSSTHSSSGLSAEYHKTTMYPSPTKRENVPEQVAKEARNVNLQYSYQPQELPAVYNTNRYLKSGSESSGISSPRRRSSHPSPAFSKEDVQSRSSSSDFDSVKTEGRKPPRPPHHSKSYTEKLIIIRELVPDSPCSTNSIASNTTFRIIDKDADSLSTTSTLEGNQLSEDDDLRLETL